MTRKAKRQAPKKTMRRQPSRLQREKRFERILIWSVIVLGLLVVGVLGYGIVFEKLIKAREPVAFVGDTPITTADFQARVGYERVLMNYEAQSLFQQLQFIDPEDPNADFYLQYIQAQIGDLQSQLSPENAEGVGEQVLEQMIQEELVRREAELVITWDPPSALLLEDFPLVELEACENGSILALNRSTGETSR